MIVPNGHRIEKYFQLRSDFVVTDSWPAVICRDIAARFSLRFHDDFGTFDTKGSPTDNGLKGLSRRRPGVQVPPTPLKLLEFLARTLRAAKYAGADSQLP
jgi:hypothetical protein